MTTRCLSTIFAGTALAASVIAQTPAAPQAPAAAEAQQQRIPRQGERATSIQGVVRGENGLGVVAAHIDLTPGGNTHITQDTTADGVFLLPNVRPGTYRLTVSREGFHTLEQMVRVPARGVTSLELVLKPIAPGENGLREVPRATGGGPLGPPPEPKTSPYGAIPRRGAGTTPGNDQGPPEPLPEENKVFTPVPNRWQYEFPKYHRYAGSGDIQFVDGHWYDPFNRNKAKGDYPVFGNSTFFNLTVTSDTFADGRRLPVGSGVGSAREDSSDFFGHLGQFAMLENVAVSATLFHGDTSFRPIDWQIRFTPEFNFNYVDTQENGIVNIDVRKGTSRYDQHAGVQELFFEYRLKDLSNEYDFVSARVGIQSFNSDFRGFIFNDQEPGLRIFGNLRSNRYQYNAAAFAMLEKDTNSGLNSFAYRHRQVFVGNLYRQDFVVPGYTLQGSFHYDKDDATLEYDQNHFLVRPQAIGAVKPHAIRSYYLGITGDGHIGRLNINHAFYQVLGHDTFNPLAGRPVDINAKMAAVELSLDKDWLRYRTSFFWASGEKNPRGSTAHGFDTILDSPNFNGGIFSFWNREGIRLTSTGVGLESGDSLVASLRSSKSQGQANFVNPGIYIYNAGVDADVLPKLRAFGNLNLIRFDTTAPLELLLFQRPIHNGVGADSGIGVKYRPKLSDNISITSGFNAFFPFQGFKDIYTGKTLFSLFTNVRFQF